MWCSFKQKERGFEHNGIKNRKCKIENLVGKWEKVGLIDGMDENKVPKLVTLYEDAANILIAGAEDGTFETVTFPVIYRIVRDTDVNDNVTAEEIVAIIKNDFENFCITITESTKDDFPEIDVEAEAVNQICDIIIENIKNKTK